MKILQIVPVLVMGGAETMCEGLTQQLLDMGHQVTVVSLYNDRTLLTERMENAGIEILYLNKKPGLDLSILPGLRRLIRKVSPDVIHTHLHVLKYAAAAGAFLGIPIVHTVHNIASYEEGSDRSINRFLYNRGIAVPVSLSREIQQSVMDFYSYPSQRSPIIFNGVDLSRCNPKSSYAFNGRPVILHAGRLNEQKNHLCIVEAARLLKEKGFDFEIRCYGEGPLQETIETAIRKAGVQDRVLLCGVANGIFRELHESDIFILPSLFEGLPMTIIEAMGTGLPVVAAQVGGVGDMITDGVSGLLISPDARELADRLEQLLTSEALRAALGQKAVAEAQRFSAREMAQNYLALYQQRCAK